MKKYLCYLNCTTLFIVAITVLVSCKKSGGGSSTKTTTIDSPFIYGTFTADIETGGFEADPLLPKSEHVIIYFWNDSVNSRSISEGNVIVNGYTTSFPYGNFGPTTPNFGFDSIGVSWTNDSSVGTYVPPGVFPTYIDTLPDTITRTGGMTINLSNTNNADSCFINFLSENGISEYLRLVSVSGNIIHLDSTTFENIALKNPGFTYPNVFTLQISSVKYNAKKVNGKKYMFYRVYNHYHPLYVK